jgi:integrase
LFTQTDRCHYCSPAPFRHLVMPVLFRTIYACDLRASEARPLRVADVDIDTGVLQIRAAKTGRRPSASRFVPGSPTTTPTSSGAPAGSGSSPARSAVR